jgi:hypothetical protein
VGRHHHRAVGHLAQFAAGLPLHPDRVPARLGPARIVEADPALPPIRGAVGDHQPHPLRVQRRRVPGRSGHELLELGHGRVGQDLNHPLDVLAGQVREQPQLVRRAVPHAGHPGEQPSEQLNKRFHGPAVDLPHG